MKRRDFLKALCISPAIPSVLCAKEKAKVIFTYLSFDDDGKLVANIESPDSPKKEIVIPYGYEYKQLTMTFDTTGESPDCAYEIWAEPMYGDGKLIRIA